MGYKIGNISFCPIEMTDRTRTLVFLESSSFRVYTFHTFLQVVGYHSYVDFYGHMLF